MINRVVLTGRLTKDPTLRKSQNNNSITSFTLAVDNGKTANGEKSTAFIDVITFNAVADNVAKYTFKGSLVAVDGRLHQRSYENKDKVKINVIEIYADVVQFLETKKEQAEAPKEEKTNNKTDEVENDDLPF